MPSLTVVKGSIFDFFSFPVILCMSKIQEVCNSRGLQFKRSIIQEVCNSKGLQFKRSIIQEVCNSRGLQFMRSAVLRVSSVHLN